MGLVPGVRMAGALRPAICDLVYVYHGGIEWDAACRLIKVIPAKVSPYEFKSSFQLYSFRIDAFATVDDVTWYPRIMVEG